MIGGRFSEAQQSLYSRLRERQSETAAERVSRPAREKKRRLRVLVMEARSSSPMRAVHRARLLAITCADNQAAVAAKRPGGQTVQSNTVLQVADGVLHLGEAAVISLQFQGGALSVRNEGVIAAADKQR